MTPSVHRCVRKILRPFVSIVLALGALTAARAAHVFIHPGIQHSQADLDRMKANLGTAPWSTAFAAFSAKSTASLTYAPRGAVPAVSRNPDSYRVNLDTDAQAAWDQAMMWYLTGNANYAAKAIQILDNWSGTLTALSGTDAQLLAGDDGILLCNAAEILRYTTVGGVGSGWSAAGITQFSSMMDNVFYPQIAVVGDANWGGSCLKTMMGIAVFTEDQAMWDKVLTEYRTNLQASVTKNNLPTGQNSESGRDQAHSGGGIWNLALVAEIAWKQGVDLYREGNNRLAAAMEYWCAYNTGTDVPFQAFSRTTGSSFFHDVIASGDRGGPTWPEAEMSYAHYAMGEGLQMPYTHLYRDTKESNPDDLLFYRLASPANEIPPAAPAAPANVAATAAANRAVIISWAPVAGATGYTVMRNVVGKNWPYGDVIADQIPATSFTDTTVAAGTTHYYTVFAHNAVARSAPSAQVSATTAPDRGWVAFRAGKFSSGTVTDDAEPPFQNDAAYVPIGSSAATHAPVYPTIDVSAAAQPAPMPVYEFYRWTAGTATYVIPQLNPLGSYTVRLHFSESVYSSVGARVFNVSINGSPVLTNFDVFAEAGATFNAVVKSFTTGADASGKITLDFTAVTNSAMISGIEIIENWADDDIGVSGASGSSSRTPGTFTVVGAGTGIGGSADSFHFTHKPVDRDGTITARLEAVTTAGTTDQAGVMLREGMAPGSRFVCLTRTGGTGVVSLQVRDTANLAATTVGTVAEPATPYFCRLTRVGGVFTGSISTDGQTWTTVGTTTLAFADVLDAGLALSSGGTTTETAVFDGVSADPSPRPVIAIPAAGITAVGLPYSYQIVADNGATTYGAANLPAGLSCDPATGLISGTPTTAGVFTVTLTASNGLRTGSQTYTLTVLAGPPQITSAASSSAAVPVPFSYAITATNSPSSYTASGLPAGLTLNTGSGVISGTPTVQGTFAVAISATNVAGTSVPFTLTLTIAPPPPPVITSATTLTGLSQYDFFSYQITATNSPQTFAASGLPPGLTLNPTTGAITGLLSAAGNFTVTLTATNTYATSDPVLLTFSVAAIAAPQNGTWTATTLISTTALASTAGSPDLTWANALFQNDDLVQLVAPTPGGFAVGAYWVVGTPSPSATFRLSATRGGSPINATTTITNGGGRRYLSWKNAGNWSSGAVAGGVGTTATVSFGANVPGIQLDQKAILGTLIVNNTPSADASFVNGAGGLFTFATTSGTPLIDITGMGSNRKFTFGPTAAIPLTIQGNQGLRLRSANYTSSSTLQTFRFQGITNWSGFSGGITLEQGIIEMRPTTTNGANNALPPQRLTLLGSGSNRAVLFFTFQTQTQTIGALDGTALAYVLGSTSNAVFNFVVGADDQDGNYAGSVCVPAFVGDANTGRVILTKTGAGTQVISGVIGDGVTGANHTAVNVNKGTLLLTAANTYQGATAVTGTGTLLVNGAIASAVTVSGSGTFGGSGTSTGNVTINSGATIAPGNRAVGTFGTTGALTLNTGAIYVCEFNGDTVVADRIVAQTVTLNDATLRLVDTGASSVPIGTVLTILQSTSAPVSGTFGDLPEGAVLTVGANLFRISYHGGTGNDVVLTALEPVAVTLDQLDQVYDGTPRAVAVTTSPTGAAVAVTYTGIGSTTYGPTSTAPVNVGTYVVSALTSAPEAYGSASATLTVHPVTPTVSLLLPTNLVYDGVPKEVVASTAPAGLHVDVTYGLSAAPSNAGSYAVVATVNDANATTVSASTTMVILPAPAAVLLSGMSATYNGSPVPVTVTTLPAGLPVNVLYAGSSPAYGPTAAPPINAGSYQVAATVIAPNFTGAAAGTLAIEPAVAQVSLSGLQQRYDGTPHPATATTDPAGLSVTITYDGNSVVPVYPGSYAVVATISDPNYRGTAADTLQIETTVLVRHAPTLNGDIDGSVQQLQPESTTLNGQAGVSGDLLVPGTPLVRLNGAPTFGGTVDAAGNPAPTNYTVTLNGHSLLRHLVRRVDPVTMPAVAAPAAPAGTRTVTLNSTADAPGDFGTVRNLTLNGHAGDIAVPAGAYGDFVANSGGSFILGTAGATEPTVYAFQSLTLNSGSSLQVVGPVIITLANGLATSGSIGTLQHPEWLVLNVANGGLTLNGGAVLAGALNAPVGSVTVNGTSQIVGSVTADTVTVNQQAVIADPQ